MPNLDDVIDMYRGQMTDEETYVAPIHPSMTWYCPECGGVFLVGIRCICEYHDKP